MSLQHIRKYLPELLSLISELWSSFSLPANNRPVQGLPVSVVYCYIGNLLAIFCYKLLGVPSNMVLTGKMIFFFRQILHLVEQLCLALNDEFRTYLPVILPCCIQVLWDAERCNDYSYVLDILHTLEVFGGRCLFIFSFLCY